jgi:hypothetical protein
VLHHCLVRVARGPPGLAHAGAGLAVLRERGAVGVLRTLVLRALRAHALVRVLDRAHN